jgi:hypothetical protein
MIWKTTIGQCLHMPWIFSKNVQTWKPIPKHFFTNLLKDLLTKDLVTFSNFIWKKIMKPRREQYATLGRQTWVPQEFKNKMLRHLVNRWMIRPTSKPWDLYDSRKQWHVDKWRRNQNPIICITLWFNRCVNMNICSKYVIS